jgi:hypothetical protein
MEQIKRFVIVPAFLPRDNHGPPAVHPPLQNDRI